MVSHNGRRNLGLDKARGQKPLRFAGNDFPRRSIRRCGDFPGWISVTTQVEAILERTCVPEGNAARHGNCKLESIFAKHT